MKFYTFEKGVKIQHETMGDAYDYDSPLSVYNLNSESFVDADVDFNSIIIKKGVAIPDLINSVPISQNLGFIVSSNLKEIFKTVILPPHKVYPVSLTQGKEVIIDYFLFNILSPKADSLEWIDYDKSEFIIKEGSCLRDVNDKPIKYYQTDERVPVGNKDEFLDVLDENRYSPIFIEANVALLKEKAPPYDLFRIPQVGITWYATETLKKMIEQSKITGVGIKPSKLRVE